MQVCLLIESETLMEKEGEGK